MAGSLLFPQRLKPRRRESFFVTAKAVTYRSCLETRTRHVILLAWSDRLAKSMYPVLDPGQPRSESTDYTSVCALAVMAKAPREGKVKTRLAPALGFDGAAAMNICFLRDTTRNIQGVVETTSKAVGLVCYTPVGDEEAFDGLLPAAFQLIAQRGDGFGERLLLATQDILTCGFGAVCLIDSDSPTMPTVALEQAVNTLMAPGDRVVLGGSHDGGYYLIGLKAAHAAPFENITWSTATVLEETRAQVIGAGLELVELPLWYDVDDGDTLRVLEAELLRGERPGFAEVDGYDAEASREFLRRRAAVVLHGNGQGQKQILRSAQDDNV